jgi:hypothetical protein
MFGIGMTTNDCALLKVSEISKIEIKTYNEGHKTTQLKLNSKLSGQPK